jgi:hypothetical protein
MGMTPWVKPGQSGEWQIKEFEITEEKAKHINLRALISGTGRGQIEPGEYLKLINSKQIIMSNSPDEIRDFEQYVWKFYGDVLVSGLGMGLVVQYLLGLKKVNHITVIEQSADVIGLTVPYFEDHIKNNRMKVIHGDVFMCKFPKNKKFDWAWHDIWPIIEYENVKEMGILRRRFMHHMKAPKRQLCWAEDYCRRF